MEENVTLFALFTISVFVAYSQNLLCDSTITWNLLPCNPMCFSDVFAFNHTSCTIRTTGAPISHDSLVMNTESIFLNPQNYPITFTIDATPFGGDMQFGIQFIFSDSMWRSTYLSKDPSSIAYKWDSADSTSYTIFKNDDFVGNFETGNNTASNITHIGFQVTTSYINDSIGVIFNSAELLTTPPIVTTTSSTVSSTTETRDDISTSSTTQPVITTTTRELFTTPLDLEVTTTFSTVGSTDSSSYITISSERRDDFAKSSTTQPVITTTTASTITSTLMDTNYVSSARSNTKHIQNSIQTTRLGTNDNDGEVVAITTDTPSVTKRVVDAEKDSNSFLTIIIVLCVLCGCLLMTLIIVFKYKVQFHKFKDIVHMIQDKGVTKSSPPVPKAFDRMWSVSSIQNEEIVTQCTSNQHNTIQTNFNGNETVGNGRNGETHHNRNESNIVIQTGGNGNEAVGNGSNGEAHHNRNEVETWLETKVKCAQYLDNFISNGYDTMDIVASVTDISCLEEIGIECVEHQHDIMKEITMLQQNGDEGATMGAADIVIYYDDQHGKLTLR